MLFLEKYFQITIVIIAINKILKLKPVYTALKTKLKLTPEQAVLMAKHAGIARFTFNWRLATWIALYAEGVKPNALVLKKFFNNHVKPVYPWLKEARICQKVTQYAFEHLGRAFGNFFSSQSGYPKFKKKGQHESFTINASGKPMSGNAGFLDSSTSTE